LWIGLVLCLSLAPFKKAKADGFATQGDLVAARPAYPASRPEGIAWRFVASFLIINLTPPKPERCDEQ
jgi:hypothetical protein